VWGLCAFGANGDLMFQIHMLPSANGAVDHNALCMNKHKSWAEIRAAAYDALTENDVELIKDHFQRRDPVTSTGLHAAIDDHCKTAVSEHGFYDLSAGVPAITPNCFSAKVGSQKVKGFQQRRRAPFFAARWTQRSCRAYFTSSSVNRGMLQYTDDYL